MQNTNVEDATVEPLNAFETLNRSHFPTFFLSFHSIYVYTKWSPTLMNIKNQEENIADVIEFDEFSIEM